MYYKLLYEQKGTEIFKRFNSFDELLECLNSLVKTGKVDAGTIYLTTVV
jgi:hypothetical protein